MKLKFFQEDSKIESSTLKPRKSDFLLTCSRRCNIKFDVRLNILSQSGHLIVFPVCSVICVIKIEFCEKHLPHIRHSYGFSPVYNEKMITKANMQQNSYAIKSIRPTWLIFTCIRLWHFNALPWAKVISHALHLNGRSPV